jgi:hypothetical protein
MDGSNLSSSATKWGIQAYNATVYASNNTIQNVGVGIGSYHNASVISSANTFTNILSSCYLLTDLSLTIRGSDTVSNAENWMTGNNYAGRPFVCSYGNLKAELLALNTNNAVSEPFYANSNNPVCICQGSKVLNVLTGAEVSFT